MYSILKTQKKKLLHKKYSPVLNSIFLTNSHILFTFADKSYLIFMVHILDSQEDVIVEQGKLGEVVTHVARVNFQTAILVTKNCKQIYHLSIDANQQPKLHQIQPGLFSQMISGQAGEGMNSLNTMGCQIKLHGFLNSNFIVQFLLHEDRKIVLDCFSLVGTPDKKYQLMTAEVDMQLNGCYVTEVCDKSQGQIAIYKQQQIQQADWELKIMRPYSKGEKKQVKAVLPGDKFPQEVSIMQVIKWLNNRYLIISYNSQTTKIETHTLDFIESENICMIEKLQNFIFFANDLKFISILHTDVSKEIFYALTHTHERIDGELYENGLIIGNMKTGSIIERGYLNYKNIDMSPDSRYILDVPGQYQSYGEIYFHLRLLLSKSSLYMFMIDNTFMSEFSAAFKENIVKLL